MTYSYNYETNSHIKFNKDATHGVIIVGGHLKNNDSNYLKEQAGRMPALLKNYSANQNILFIQLDETNISLEQLKDEIAAFAEKNSKVSVISGIHGLHPFSLEGQHVLQFKNASTLFEDLLPKFLLKVARVLDYGLDYIANGAYISSVDYIKSIIDATGDKLSALWQTSCQGSLLIPKLENILPEGVPLYTETDRFHTSSWAVLDSIVKDVEQSREINFDDMLANISAEVARVSSLYGWDADKNWYMSYSPIKTTDGEQVKYTSLINDFISNAKVEFDSAKYSQDIKIKYLEIFGDNNDKQRCNVSVIESALEKLSGKADWDFSKCVYGRGSHPWINEIFNNIFGIEPEMHDCPVDSQTYLDLLSCVTLLGEDHPLIAAK